ncbi:AAA family ATPase [Clostridium sp. YIM B02505]|uniref:AAA family ATPase n=1 Tax=Clostridium yunnanense TaxID=2800325 RepID=A0ABS1EPV7_9CLOT|nr:AAA family ATPase [Clostridium yunnanense]MBK1811385.1 AAA family ATPase [Clostridium yunnanense]
MIIKKIDIKSFGKLRNKEINFTEGVNIVYGHNESGKSTIQTFIKACFYGMNSKRVKDVRENERLRYLNFNDNKAEGEIHFEYNNDNYIIRRTFGSTKKEDTIQTIDCITGEEIPSLNIDNVGKNIFDVNSAAFENTLFIKQLSAEVKNSKEDDILHKISNSFQTGNENISYQKAKDTLDQYKKSLVTQRKGGKLDLLKVRFDTLLDERNNAIRLAEANLNNEKNYLEVKAMRDELEITIKKLEIYKKHLKRLKLKEEYGEITDYLRKSQELKKRKEEYEYNLISNNGVIDYYFLDGLQEDVTGLFNLLDINNQRKEEEKQLLEELEEKNNYLSIYENFGELDLNIDEKLIKVSIEQKLIEEKISMILDTNEEIDKIEYEIKQKINNLRDYKTISEHREEINRLLLNYEEDLKEIKFLIDRNSKTKVEKKQIERLKVKNRAISSVSLILSICAVFSVFAALTSLLPLNIGVVIAFILFIISGIMFMASSRNKYYIEQGLINLEEQSTISTLTDSFKQYEEQLNKYFNITGSTDHISFKKYLNTFDTCNNQIEILKARIGEKRNSIKTMNLYELEDSAIRNEKIINSVLSITNSRDIEEFVKNIKQYRIINQEKEEIDNRIVSIRKNLDYLQNDIKLKKDTIYSKLKTLGLEHLDIEDIPEQIKNMRYKLQQREEIMVRLNSIEETYKLLLKDRDIQAIEEEVKEIINETNEFSYENEDEIENDIRSKQQELLNIEKEMKDIEYSIKNIFLTTRRLDVIEEDIESVKEQIKEGEKTVRAIEVAQAIMDESFKEIQKSFGPVLNEKVTAILSKITMGKYSDVKINETFEITIKQSSDGRYIKAEYLSNGAWDQAYISLRLALIDMIFENKNVPIILDDAFVQYDDERLENILNYLYEISDMRQIIIFTCQKRELNIACNRDGVNTISI